MTSSRYCGSSEHIEDKAVTGDIINIRKMAEDTVRMVTESIDAFVKGDLELCRKVIDDDDRVDDAFNDIKEKLAEVLNNGKAGCKHRSGYPYGCKIFRAYR